MNVAIVPDLLDLRASIVPERTAIISASESISYAEWRERSFRYAHGLEAKGVRPGDRVAVILPDSDITHFGAMYVALQRLAACPVVCSARWNATELGELLDDLDIVGVVSLSDTFIGSSWSATPDQLAGHSGRPFLSKCVPSDPAQIIFTSGSTGISRAVVATHANLVGGVGSRIITDKAQLENGPVFAHAIPLGTNAAQSMLLTCFTEPDITVVLDAFDPAEFLRTIEKYRVVGTLMVPAMAQALLSFSGREDFDVSTVEHIGLTGAATPVATLLRLSEAFPSARIENFYTTTEAWPTGSNAVFDPERPTSIGRVSDKSSIRIVAEGDDSPLSSGESGEILLAGGAAAGRALMDGSEPSFDDGWVRTGDIGFMDSDGYLHLTGRRSKVIQTGGFKVAPPEIEAVLCEHSAVISAVVFGVTHAVLGEIIVAGVVGEVDIDELAQYVATRVSAHKIPHRIFSLRQLPVTAAGKIDEAKIRKIYGALRAGYLAPTTSVEAELCKIWSEVLGVDGVGIDDDFFELGGYSIAALTLAGKISIGFGIRVTVTEVYEARTVRALAARIGRIVDEPTVADDKVLATKCTDDPATETGSLLSGFQAWLWQMSYVDADGVRRLPGGSNVNFTLHVAGVLDCVRLNRALTTVARRHEALRTIFVDGFDGPMQNVTEDSRLELACESIDISANDLKIRDVLKDAWLEEFNLSSGPIGRLHCYWLADGTTILFWVVSHLVVDGWSLGIIMRDLADVYSGRSLGKENSRSYAAAAAARTASESTADGASKRKYWQRVFSRPHGLPEFPWYVRSGIHPVMDRGACIRLSDMDSDIIRALARNAAATPFTVWGAAYVSVLTAWGNDSDMVVSVPMLGRDTTDYGVVGPLSVSSAVRFNWSANGTVRELLRVVRDSVISANANQLSSLDGIPGADAAAIRRIALSVEADGGSSKMTMDTLPVVTFEPRTDAIVIPEGGRPGIAVSLRVLEFASDDTTHYQVGLFADSRIIPDPERMAMTIVEITRTMQEEPGMRLEELRQKIRSVYCHIAKESESEQTR